MQSVLRLQLVRLGLRGMWLDEDTDNINFEKKVNLDKVAARGKLEYCQNFGFLEVVKAVESCD